MRRTVALSLVAMLGTFMLPTSARAERTVTITGGGWGHGIGMSQYGAYGRAQNGASPAKILKHYYTGVRLDSRKMPSIRVGLLQGRGSISLSGTGKIVWKVAGSNAVLAKGGSQASWRVEPSQAGGFKLFKNGDQIRRDGNGVFGDTDSPLKIKYEPFGTIVDVADKSYNYELGTLEVGLYSSSGCDAGFCLRLIVQLSMQKYLLGLAEVPSSWPQAVLRAQAMAGRTYAYDKWERSGSHRYPCDCTVYDSTIDQAYAGNGKRVGSDGTQTPEDHFEAWSGAVAATDGRIITHNGDPIQALYSSSSGGHTENNEHVWGGTPLPFLRGVPDKTDSVSINPNHRWDPTEMTFRAFARRVEPDYPSIGNLQDVRIVKRGVSERVSALDGGGLELIGSTKTMRVSGWDFRTNFGSDILKDTLFYFDIKESVGQQFVSTYRRLDGAPGDAKAPPYAVPKGADRPLGKAQNFEVGRMTWRRVTDKAVWQWGPVLRKYNRVGRENSRLGMPTSGIWGKEDRFRGGSYVRGVIFWSENTGAHLIRNTFFETFRTVGGKKRLGLPTTDIKETERSGRIQRFVNGTLYNPPDRVAVFALWGPIDERYRKLGMARSRCGLPTSSVVVDSSGAAASFRNGSITYSAGGGVSVNCG